MNLVTGATGFIGRHLARRLVRDGHPVRVLCRKGREAKLPKELAGKIEIRQGDLRDRDSLVAAVRGATRVFHCAGLVSDWVNEEAVFATNVQGTRWLLEAAQEGGAERFIHLSSIAAFGTPAPPYFDDRSEYGNSRDAYSRSKAEGEKLALELHRTAGLPVTVLRPAVVYGPEGAWLEEPLAMIEQGKMFLLGGGAGICHPCYIENLVDAMLLAAEHPAAVGQAFIVADGQSVSFRDYFNAIAFIAGKPPIHRSIPLVAARAMATVFEAAARMQGKQDRPLLTRTAIAMVTTKSRMSIEKIRRELGWQPRYTFQAATEELRGWYANRTLVAARPEAPAPRSASGIWRSTKDDCGARRPRPRMESVPMLTIEGEVAAPRSIDPSELRRLPAQIEDVSTVVPGRDGSAVWLRDLLAQAGVNPSARFVTLASGDGKFAISLPLQPLLERAVLVYRRGEAPLLPSSGGPVRVLLTGKVECQAPDIDACAMVKGLGRIRVTSEREPDVGHLHH